MRYCVVVLLFFFFQCTDHQQSEMSASVTGLAMDNEEGQEVKSKKRIDQGKAPEFQLEQGSKIIKSGRLVFEVDDLKQVKSTIDNHVNSLGAYYEKEQFDVYGNSNSYSIVIRVPNAKFDALVSALEKGESKLISKNVSSKDVTEQYVDLNIRLDNNKAYLNQYNEILKQAKSIKEILDVKERIQRLEEGIDSKMGRIKYLDDKVKFSTLNIELNEYRIIDSSENTFFKRMKYAVVNGFHALLDLVVFLLSLWPFILIIFIIWMMRRRVFTKFWK